MGLTELVDISRSYGRNPDFVLAGGGNTSYKDDRLLYVKASGTTLAELTEEGLVRMRRDRLDAIWKARYSDDPAEREAQALADLMAAREEGEAKRPSVETLLHALLRQRYVVHTHPAIVNGMTCGGQGKRIAAELFGDAILWIPVTNPGYVLAATIRSAIENRLDAGGEYPSVILLENHGIFVASDSLEEIRRLYAEVMSSLESRLHRRPDTGERQPDRAADAEALAGAFAREVAPAAAATTRPAAATTRTAGRAIFLYNAEVAERVADARSFAPLASFAYTPDHLVYCREAPLWVPFETELDAERKRLRGELARYRERFGPPPRVAAFERRGVAIFGENEATLGSARDLFLDLLRLVRYAESFGGPKLMPEPQIDFIRNWEVEKYRASVNSGRSS